ncbi:MAG: hypothetical protein EAX91_12825 [Candidatus Lokiarchaeota archaeon]|nr:hypothetical protein [Candidatus Lokiarchaeota archaeon]
MKNVNTLNTINTKKKLKKDKWIQIRVDEDTKDKIEELAWLKRIPVSKLMLDAVSANLIAGKLDNNPQEFKIKALVEGIFEFIKIMKFNKGNLRLPANLDKSKIMKAIRLSRTMKSLGYLFLNKKKK